MEATVRRKLRRRLPAPVQVGTSFHLDRYEFLSRSVSASPQVFAQSRLCRYTILFIAYVNVDEISDVCGLYTVRCRGRYQLMRWFASALDNCCVQ